MGWIRRSRHRRNNTTIVALDQLEPRWLLSTVAGTVIVPASDASRATNPTGLSFTQYQLFQPAGDTSPNFPTPIPGFQTPLTLPTAYGINQIKFGATIGDGTGQTIAIIDAYDNPSFVSSTDPNFDISDLHRFDQQFGLPDPPSFTKVDQTGNQNYPVYNNGWAGEIALDVEYAHAVAPGANIILVEATTNAWTDQMAAVTWARQQPNVSVVTMSFGGYEFPGETALDSNFVTPAGHQGITYFASTGDYAAPGLGYPSYSPNVVAVGGTTLLLNPLDNTWLDELGWSGNSNLGSIGGGGGVSIYEPKPDYQYLVSTPSATQRTIPDVSMDADPVTGVNVLDTSLGGIGSADNWELVGGTSLASPMWAGLGAIIDQGRTLMNLGTLDGRTQMLPRLYSAPSVDFHDITQGNNGFAAGVGYDLVTGIGSPIANKLCVDIAQDTLVRGTVFKDVNSNGLLDATDPAMPGIMVNLYGVGLDGTANTADDVLLTNGIAPTDPTLPTLSPFTTDAIGQYSFLLNPSQAFFVTVQRPTGYYFTAEYVLPGSAQNSDVNSQGISDPISTATHGALVNAGLIPTNIQIAGVVFNDSDMAPATLPDGSANPSAYLPNGIYNDGESGPAGSVVKLYEKGATDTLVASQTTANGGAFNFTLLDAGTYYVVVAPPTPAYLFTKQDQGTDPTRQSVVDWTTGQSDPIAIANGQQKTDENAGIYLPRVQVANGIAPEGNASELVDNQLQFPMTMYVFPGQITSQPAIVTYSTVPQSALADVDYQSVIKGSAEVDPGDATASAPPSVNLIGNDILTPNKVFFITLTSDNAQLINTSAVGTIANDDPDVISIDASGAQVSQTPNGVTAYFTVSLAVPFAGESVSVGYAFGAAGDTAVGAVPSDIINGTVKLNDVDYVAPTLSGTLTFDPGQTTARVSVLVLDNFHAAGFNINNPPTRTFTLTLSDPSVPAGSTSPAPVFANQAATASATGNIVTDPVRNAAATGNGATYRDNSGNSVTVKLSGPGTAAVQLRGASGTDGVAIVLSGTTSASRLVISSSGSGTTIDQIIDDSALGSINAPNVNLTGSINIAGGLKQLRLNSVTPTNLMIVPGVNLSPGAQLTIGGGPLGSVLGLNAKIGRVTDTSFALGIPIKSMHLASVNDQDGQPNRIFAPSIGRLKIDGDFTENIQTNDLKNLKVSGTIENSRISATQNIGRVTASAMTGSQIYAGLPSTQTGFPTDSSAFDPQSSIRSVNLRGREAKFSGSVIAAADVGRVKLGTVDPANGGVTFGVSALRLSRARGAVAGSIFSVPHKSSDLGNVFSNQDFLIKIFGV